MSIQFSESYDPGFTLYALVLDPAERAWNGTAFVDPTGIRPTCDIPMVYDAGSGTYIGDVPSSLPVGPTGTYTVRSYLQMGGSPDDPDPVVGVGTITVVGAVAPRVSWDRDFLAGMIHSVAVEFDNNSVGSYAGAHPGRPADWQPVTGLETLACRVVIKRAIPIENGSVRVGRILFGQEVVADQRYSMLFNANGAGVLRLYLTGPVIEAVPPGHHWLVDFQDRPLQ